MVAVPILSETPVGSRARGGRGAAIDGVSRVILGGGVVPVREASARM